jgi:hypothetical protein
MQEKKMDKMKQLYEKPKKELSDTELDMVAGGKQTLETHDFDPTGSIAALGMGCVVTSSNLR